MASVRYGQSGLRKRTGKAFKGGSSARTRPPSKFKRGQISLTFDKLFIYLIPNGQKQKQEKMQNVGFVAEDEMDERASNPDPPTLRHSDPYDLTRLPGAYSGLLSCLKSVAVHQLREFSSGVLMMGSTHATPIKIHKSQSCLRFLRS